MIRFMEPFKEREEAQGTFTRLWQCPFGLSSSRLQAQLSVKV